MSGTITTEELARRVSIINDLIARELPEDRIFMVSADALGVTRGKTGYIQRFDAAPDDTEWTPVDPDAKPKDRGDPTGGGVSYPLEKMRYRGHDFTRRLWSCAGAGFFTYCLLATEGMSAESATAETTWEGDMCFWRNGALEDEVVKGGGSLPETETLDRLIELAGRKQA